MGQDDIGSVCGVSCFFAGDCPEPALDDAELDCRLMGPFDSRCVIVCENDDDCPESMQCLLPPSGLGRICYVTS
jgi:hypothetical protein